MFTVISRIVHYGFKNFWRNGWPSAATVAIMVVALSVFLGLIFFNTITEHAVASIQDKIDISVYFKTDTPEDEILSIKDSIESLSEVKEVEYVSSDQALEVCSRVDVRESQDFRATSLETLRRLGIPPGFRRR